MNPRQWRHHVEAMVLIAAGGMIGATLRYLLGGIAGEALVMTVAINGVGSFLLGLLLFHTDTERILAERFRYIFGTGLLASFTTYSTFVADIALNDPSIALAYLAASYLAGFGGVVLSWSIGTWIPGGIS